MFPTRKPTSDFTLKAFDGHVKELEELTGFSKTDLYAIQAGERPDHLLYARELHRGLSICNAEAAREYRETLAADAELVAPKAKGRVESADDLTVKRLCDGLTTALLGDEGEKLAAMRKLFEVLGARLRPRMGAGELRREIDIAG